MSSVCLVVIFNHRYEDNIDRLRKIYNGRFSHIKFLVPFYRGKDKDVIPVFDSSYYFNAFVTQAFNKIYLENFKHYFFVADDLYLNPEINENNYEEYFDISGKSLISTPKAAVESGLPLRSFLNIYDSFNYITSGCHWEKELPTVEDASLRFDRHGYINMLMVKNNIYEHKGWRRENLLYSYRRPKVALEVLMNRFKLPYPVVCGFSDFYIIRGDKLKDFCFLSGVFASINLQVEMATPTAMLLVHSPEEILLLDRGENVYHARDYQFLKKYNGNLQLLLDNWNEKCSFIHPIKLSQWR